MESFSMAKADCAEHHYGDLLWKGSSVQIQKNEKKNNKNKRIAEVKRK